MRQSAMEKMSDSMYLIVIISAFIAVFAGFMPDYQKSAYAKEQLLSYDEYAHYTGYPGTDDYPTASDYDEMKELKNFVIETDVRNIKATGLYITFKDMKLFGKKGLKMFRNLDDGGVGQLYLVNPNGDGDSIFVLLDDDTINIPKSGTVRLPIGEIVNKQYSSMMKYYDEAGKNNVEWYVDAATDWRNGVTAKAVERQRYMISFGTFVGSAVILYIISRIVSRKIK